MRSPNIPLVAAPPVSTPADDPVPADVHAVIELLAGPLAKVSFPEIDAASLRRQADELRAESQAVARARDALEAAQASFVARRTALSETSARAVAYAKIYSEAHPDRTALAEAISALSSPRSSLAPELTVAGKRRGRPPRRSAELFDPAAAGEPAAEPA